MAYIGWGTATNAYPTYQFPAVAPFARENTGIYEGSVGERYICGVVGAYSTVVFSHAWSPVASSGTPVSVANQVAETYVLDLSIAFSPPTLGTLTISALIDGVAAQNTLVLVLTTQLGSYADVAWAEAIPAPTDFWTNFVAAREIL